MVDQPSVNVCAETLRLINEAIEALGWQTLEELPLGCMRSSTNCVIALAFSGGIAQPVSVQSHAIYMVDPGDIAKIAIAWGTSQIQSKTAAAEIFGDQMVYGAELPDVMMTFIELFDEGELPNFVDPAMSSEASSGGSGSDGGGAPVCIGDGIDGGTGGAPACVVGGAGGGSGGAPSFDELDYLLGGSEASPVLVGGSEAGGGA